MTKTQRRLGRVQELVLCTTFQDGTVPIWAYERTVDSLIKRELLTRNYVLTDQGREMARALAGAEGER